MHDDVARTAGEYGSSRGGEEQVTRGPEGAMHATIPRAVCTHDVARTELVPDAYEFVVVQGREQQHQAQQVSRPVTKSSRAPLPHRRTDKV